MQVGSDAWYYTAVGATPQAAKVASISGTTCTLSVLSSSGTWSPASVPFIAPGVAEPATGAFCTEAAEPEPSTPATPVAPVAPGRGFPGRR